MMTRMRTKILMKGLMKTMTKILMRVIVLILPHGIRKETLASRVLGFLNTLKNAVMSVGLIVCLLLMLVQMLAMLLVWMIQIGTRRETLKKIVLGLVPTLRNVALSLVKMIQKDMNRVLMHVMVLIRTNSSYEEKFVIESIKLQHTKLFEITKIPSITNTKGTSEHLNKISQHCLCFSPLCFLYLCARIASHRVIKLTTIKY
mmetsp:Transcript_1927/g.2562  ORF Transcript_1927/g.2562 Transcript_1927/m.2562 type:complete len:202 (-) Transcript_1927:169-774(-)